uniref:leucine-rich repeat protein 1 isoform X1 n=2 Tax=Myxine glutinosa TaxID=7769 RepID=UPI00358E722C
MLRLKGDVGASGCDVLVTRDGRGEWDIGAKAMRLICDVECVSCLLPAAGLRSSSRPVRTVLTIGRQPGQSGPVGLRLLVATDSNRAGKKYYLKGNVQQFFTRFVCEGKSTIRLKEPSLELRLSQADVACLKNFLAKLHLASQGKLTEEKTRLPSLAPACAKDVKKPQCRLAIHSQKAYPVLDGFPSSLKILQISNCLLAHVDNRITGLALLRQLDLSCNRLRRLPGSLGALPHLAVLILSNNLIETFPSELCQSLGPSLRLLDLVKNQLRSLPPQLFQMPKLCQLNVDNNELVELPIGLKGTRALRIFSAEYNNLRWLPPGFRTLRLDYISLFGNDFVSESQTDEIHLKLPPTLWECAARAVLLARMPHTQALLPKIIREELELARPCEVCSGVAFSSFVQSTTSLNLSRIVYQSIASPYVPVLCFLCSRMCYDKFLRVRGSPMAIDGRNGVEPEG